MVYQDRRMGPCRNGHIGVQGLAAGDAEEHPAEHQQTVSARMHHEAHRMGRIERREHFGVAHDGRHAEQRDHQEPEEHDGPNARPIFSVPNRCVVNSTTRTSTAMGMT